MHWLLSDTPVRQLVLIFTLTLALACSLRGAEPALTWKGQVETDQGITTITERRSAIVVVGSEEDRSYALTFEMKLTNQTAPAVIVPYSAAPHDSRSPGAMTITLRKSRQGGVLTFNKTGWNAETSRFAGNTANGPVHRYPVAPDPENARAVAQYKADNPHYSLEDHWIALRLEMHPKHVDFWVDGSFIQRFALEQAMHGPVRIAFQSGVKVRNLKQSPLPAASAFVPVDLSGWVRKRADDAPAATTRQEQGIPFVVFDEGKANLDLSLSNWADAMVDPSSYNERYDNGPAYQFDPRQPTLSVPVEDYAAIHLLAYADGDKNHWPGLTVRAGHFNNRGQTLYYDFPANVPVTDGRLVHVRIPMSAAFAQDVQDRLELTLTKEVRLARRRPDPSRFRHRPLGIPSGVRVAAVTLERSPLQVRITSDHAGHAFVQPAKADFHIQLISTQSKPQRYRLVAKATHISGESFDASTSGTIDAGQSTTVTLTLPTTRLGYHDLQIDILVDDQPLFTRHTSFATLPTDTRKHRDSSPFGTWDFSGGHLTSKDADAVGSLYQKAGLRFGMFKFTAEQRAKWGVRQGSEFKGKGDRESYDKWTQNNPDGLPVFLLLHEHAVSGGHISRTPDIFHDRKPYVMNEVEQKRFKDLWDLCVNAATSIRQIDPKIELRLGNGGLPTKEELLRQKFPRELFDALGNEAGSFGRPPETQPPDWVGNNAGLWMDHELLKAYGYDDKKVIQCYEICYPSTNPGNLSPQTQADYFVRHAVHSVAWGIEQVRFGIISDTGNSYRYSNWGASGLTRPYPELNVKPSFVAVATMTRLLDGATFDRKIDLGSHSLYAAQFTGPDKQPVVVLWTLRGRRDVELSVIGNNWMLTDDQGESKSAQVNGGKIRITLTPSPVYLTGQGSVAAGNLGEPAYTDAPVGQRAPLSTLDSMDDWSLETERDYVLEYHNFMTPRRLGQYAAEPVASFEGREKVLRITPGPLTTGKDTMPMYGVLRHHKGIAVPGRPTEVGLWVNGNSGWGRIIFEFKDASGQTWTSIGAPQRGELSPWMLDWMPKEALENDQRTTTQADWNTDDVFGVSRINFDGWRYVGVQMPGHYPGEGYPWPAASQWRYDGDGVVKYPLTFTRLAIELNTKVLHMTDYQPVRRPAVYLSDLMVTQDDRSTVKQTIGEWTP